MRSAHKQKNPTISNVKSLDLWSEWRESNSRPLEPHSSALPKLRYTRISTAASLPKRGDMRYYTQIQQFCQQIFTIFFAFFVKKSDFCRKYALYSFLLFRLQKLVFFQKRFQILTGKAARHLCHLFRRAFGHDLAACTAAFRPRSMIWSAHLIRSRLCSMTITVLPASTSSAAPRSGGAHLQYAGR